jgi:hypothetical protein
VILTAGVAHPRKVIRHYIVALLTNATAAGPRVKATRIEPHRKPHTTHLPAISVYTLREPVNTDKSADTAPRALFRDCKVEIVLWVAGPTDPDIDIADAMDDLSEQVEAMIDGDRYLGGIVNGLARDTILENTELAVRGGEGADPVIGVVTMTYSIEYRSTAAKPATDEFLRVHAKTRIVGVEDAGAATNDINVRPT